MLFAGLLLATVSLPGALRSLRLNACGLLLVHHAATAAVADRAAACMAGDDPAADLRLRAVAAAPPLGSASATPGAKTNRLAAGDLAALATFADHRGAPGVAAAYAAQALDQDARLPQAWLADGDALTCRLRQPWGYDKSFAGCSPDWTAAVSAYRHAAALRPDGQTFMALALAEHESGAAPAANADLVHSLTLASSPAERYYLDTLQGDWQLQTGDARAALASYRAAASQGFPVSAWWRQQEALAQAHAAGGSGR